MTPDRLQKKYKLTEREKEIAVMLAEALQQKEIASRLCISVATVKFHLNNLRLKLQSPSMLAAAVRVAQTIAG